MTRPVSLLEPSARLVDLPCHRETNGHLVVAETAAHVPFAIARMFTISAPAGAVRGEHAHRRCSQFMLCVHGAVDIACSDGRKRDTFTLDRPDLALLVPPGIWNTVTFRQAGSVVAVLCDRLYEKEDYIRDHAEFLRWCEARSA